jgi:SSS family solute:Na+ symporter
MYPHAVTGVLASRRRNVIRRNMAILPAYSLMLGFVALLGYMALAAPASGGGQGQRRQRPAGRAVPVPEDVPALVHGIAFSAIAIGALVPAAIMSIAAANLFTRNIYKEYSSPTRRRAQETRVAQTVSLVVKLGALIFVLALSKTFSINLQLLGGIWILQTFPAIVIGLYTRWFHRWALIAAGRWRCLRHHRRLQHTRARGAGLPLRASVANVPASTTPVYIALTALVINLVVAAVLTAVFRLAKLPAGTDETAPPQYLADPEGAPAAAAPVTPVAADSTRH